MTITKFWQMIDEVREEAGSWEEMQEPLVERLATLDLEDLFLWAQMFGEYQRLSYREKLRAAAYVINGGCSDDGFDYFRAWLTAQGWDTFHAALRDPDSMAELDCCEEDVGYEDILAAGADAFFRKLNIEGRPYDRFYNELEQHPLPDDLRCEMLESIEYDKEIDAEWDEDYLEELLPRLCEAFDW